MFTLSIYLFSFFLFTFFPCNMPYNSVYMALYAAELHAFRIVCGIISKKYIIVIISVIKTNRCNKRAYKPGQILFKVPIEIIKNLHFRVVIKFYSQVVSYNIVAIIYFICLFTFFFFYCICVPANNSRDKF